MQVRKEGVVGVLQATVRFLQHVLVPEGRQYGGHRRLADVAAQTLAVLVAQRLEALQLAHPGQVVELLTAVGEVLAQPLVRLDAKVRQGLIHHLLEQVAATAAAGARFGAALHRRELMIARPNGGHHLPLADVVAGAEDGAVRQHQGRGGGARLPHQQGERRLGQRHPVLVVLQQPLIITAVPHQDGAEQAIALAVGHQLLVDALDPVQQQQLLGAGGAGVGVADGAHVHPHQLELGGHVRPREAALAAAQAGHGGPDHLVAGGHQPEDASLPERALADGEDGGIRAVAAVVDADATALPDHQPGLAGQGVGGSDPRGEQQDVGLNVSAVLEAQPVASLLPLLDALGGLLHQHLDPEGLDLVPQHGAAALVELHRHQPRGELHHLGLEPEQAQGVGRLQPQQAAADDHAAAGLGAGIADGGEIPQGAIHEAPLPLMAGDGGHEGDRAGRQHQAVVRELLAVGQRQGAGGPVEHLHLGPQPQRYAVLFIPGGIRHAQRLRGLAAKYLGQMHPVVGGVRLGAKYRHLEPAQATGRHQLFDEVVTHHAVAHHQQPLLCGLFGGSGALASDKIHAVAYHPLLLFVSHVSLP